MFPHRKRWLILLASLVITMGCAFAAGTADTPAKNNQLIATAVAATMTEQQGAAQMTVAAAAQPTLTKAAEATPLPEPSPTALSVTAAPPASVSPNRLVVAYVDTGHNIWIWEAAETGAAGSSRQLTKTGDVSGVKISDDASWVAFLRSTDQLHYDLWAARTDGSGEQLLMNAAAFDAIPRQDGAVSTGPNEIQWVPNTHILAFNTRPFFDGLGMMLNNDLWLANPETGEHKQLLITGQGGRFYYSPDGAQIALVMPTTISLINADGSNRREDVLKYTPVSTYSEYLYYAEPHWASDSRMLRVVIPPPASLEHPEVPSTIWEIPVDGSAGRQIGSVLSLPIVYPVLSPDLSKLAFIQKAASAPDSQGELHISLVDGSQDTVYQVAPNLMFHGWAQDSNRFLFSSDADGRPALGLVGSAPVITSSAVNIDSVKWVDARRFLFVTRSPNPQLRLATLALEDQVIYSSPDASMPYLEYDFAK